MRRRVSRFEKKRKALRERRKLEEKVNLDRLPIKTEYEVGINFFVDNLSSIIQECAKVNEIGDLRISAGYIEEKLDKAVDAVNEYSRDLYIKMFNEETAGEWDYREEVYETAKKMDGALARLSASTIITNVQSELDDITYDVVVTAISAMSILLDRLMVSFNSRMKDFTNDLKTNAFNDATFLDRFEEFVTLTEELLVQA